MKAEIISIGTELLLGHVINTDAAFIARELATLGFDLKNMQIVGDNAMRLKEALETALKRSDIIITSGGLGPTDDDLTKETVAEFLNLSLEENAECKKALLEYFGDREAGPNQLKQTFIPKGSKVLKNPHGTAPGCVVPAGGGKFICILPGPPKELLPMLKNELSPFLAGLTGKTIKSTQLKVFGPGEGKVAELLKDLTRNVNPSVATYASDGEMFVKISVATSDNEEALNLMEPVVAQVRDRLGNFIYGRDVSNLEEVVVKLLIKEKLHLATAESCTGGLVSKRITDVAGASAVFHLGVVSYANKAKEKILGVCPETLARYGAVSSQTAREMAEGIRNLANADFGIGITGIAGPDGGTTEKPVGLVYIALAGNETHIKKMEPHGRYPGREAIRNKAASTALDMLRRVLLGLPISEDF